MAFLRWRRIIEILALDRPGLGRLLLRRPRAALALKAGEWDAEYQRGAYDRLFRSEQRHHLRLLAAMVADERPELRVLEIGCGEGAFWATIRPFAPARYVGVDFSATAVSGAETRFADDIATGRASFAVADGRSFESEERFDAILFPECIEHLGDLTALLAHYRRLLRPGGCFGLSMWLGSEPVRRWWKLRGIATVQDEAVVCSAWGGAWVVARLTPVPEAD